MHRIRGRIASYSRNGDTEKEQFWRAEYDRLKAIELRRAADELDAGATEKTSVTD